jgi:hypothetical protein
MLKDVLEKALSTILVTVIIGLGTLLYNEFETYKEIRDLLEVRHELEDAFKEEVKDRKAIQDLIIKRIHRLEKQSKKDSTTLKYTKEWVDYWVSLR